MKRLLTSLLVFAVAGGTASLAQQPRGGDGEQTRDPLQFNPQPPRDRSEYRPPIVDAPFIKADAVVDQVLPEELVLGTVIGGQARAYPLNMLTGPSREIINDMVGGRAIAATW